MFGGKILLTRMVAGAVVILAALPATSNYKLNGYGFGSGGTANSTTSNYKLEGSSGELAGQTTSTATYKVKPGFTETIQANVPQISSFTNNSGSYYNRLKFVIDEQNNPSDAKYALSISTDNFSSDIRYVKSDLTVGGSLALTDYQTYSAWGGASGSIIIGLSPSTTYYLKAKATQGTFTESQYGPVSSASTVGAQLSFSLSTTSLSMGALPPGTVVDAPSTIDLTFATNANGGGGIFISGSNGGLFSSRTSTTITSATADLTPATRGFGARVTATGASSGTLTSLSPYNGTLNNVGITNSTIRQVITANGPIVGGTSSILVKAKVSNTDPADTNYTETLTLIASGYY